MGHDASEHDNHEYVIRYGVICSPVVDRMERTLPYE